MDDQNILPIGFYDLYGKRATNHFAIISKILGHLTNNGFDLFIPTALEFSHNSSDKTHNNIKAKPFSVHDPLSEAMLTIRDDITPQITRALNYSKSSNPKICYYGDVYRSNISSSEQRRKFTQVGFEIINDDNNKITSECFQQLLAILKQISLTDYKIVISLPNILRSTIEELKISKENIKEFSRAVNELDLSAIKDKYNIDEIFLELLVGCSLDQVDITKIPHNLSSTCDILKTLSQEIPTNIKQHIICNLRDDQDHENIAFSIISSNSNATYARGGDYKINNKKGCGISFYVEEILGQIQK